MQSAAALYTDIAGSQTASLLAQAEEDNHTYYCFFGAYSVLIHLLPGLALFAQRHFSPPESVSHIGLLSSTKYGGEHDGSATFWWFLVAPFIFYATWQTAYWLIVQVNPETYRATEAFRQCCVKGKCADMSIPSDFSSMHMGSGFTGSTGFTCCMLKQTEGVLCRSAVSITSRSMGMKPATAA